MSHRIDRFLKLMNDRGASDLHLSVGRPPIFRLSGRMDPVRYRVLDDRDFVSLLEPITPPHLWSQFVNEGDADYAYEVPGLARSGSTCSGNNEATGRSSASSQPGS